MNKLISKIVGVALGLALATGVGAGVVLGNTKGSEAAYASTSPVTIDLTTNQTTSASDNALVWSYDEFTVTASKESGTKVTNYWPGTGANHTRLYNNNKITFAPASGYQIDSITITATGDSYLKVGTTSTATNASISTSGAVATVTPTSKTSNVVLTCNGTGRYNSIAVAFSAASSAASITLGKASMYVATTTENTLDVAYANLTANISVSQSGSGSVLLSTDGETYNSSLTLNKATASPQTIYVKGNTAGTATLSFASTGVTTQTCTVNVTAPNLYQKITKVAEIKDGGKFIIAAEGTSTVMSTLEGSGNRSYATATIISDKINVPTVADPIDIITITAGTGTYAGYYLLYDASYNNGAGGYLEYYNSGLSTYKPSGTPSQDVYYWSISFASGIATIQNKSDSTMVIQYNTSAKTFKTYAGTQKNIELYELESDIPSDTALTSITGSDLTLGAGETTTYSATYAPANATESISASLTPEIATLGTVSMNNGTVSFSITAGSSSGTATLLLEGDNGTVSESVTLTVSAFTSTHTLVTSASSLVNGAKVVFGSTSEDENTNYSGVAHTGGDYVPVVATAYNSDKTALSAAATTKEYTVWCVDSTNGYYVFSDGGYFLAAPTSAGNKLNRVDTLGPRCYFLITDSADGVLITSQYGIEQEWKYNNNPVNYTVQFNYNSGTNSRFALYRAESQKAASLYISNESVNKVQGFVDAFMHFGNVGVSTTTDTGACKDSGKSYFKDAQTAYALLSASEKQTFCTGSAYANAYARLSAWATANGYIFDSYSLVEASRLHVMNQFVANNNALIIVVITAFVSATFIGGYFFLRKKKEN